MTDIDSAADSLGAAGASPQVLAATPEEFDALLASRNDILIVLYMWGPDCPNCEFFAKRMPALLDQLKGAKVVLVKVDVYARPELARRYGVFGIPHFLLFRAGKRLGKMSEFRGDAYWLGVIRDNLPVGQEEHPPAGTVVASQSRMEQLTTSDPMPHVMNVRDELHDLVEHLRNDAHIVKDPKARALFETSAEVLTGLERAFEHFANHSEPAWQK